MVTESIFSYAGLIKCLQGLAGKTALFPLRDWEGQPGIILRHDVDLDVRPAHALASKEAAAGLYGTFFFMTTAPTYNLSAPSNREMIREMVAMGVEIALHFDPLVYSNQTDSYLASAARSEAELISDIAGAEVCSVSIHNPSVHGTYPMFAGFKNAYDPKIFASDLYLSDSRMTFRHDPVEFFRGACEKTMQLLLHPLHYSERGLQYPAPMLAFLRKVMDDVDHIFSVNSTYRHAVGTTLASMLAKEARSWAKKDDTE